MFLEEIFSKLIFGSNDNNCGPADDLIMTASEKTLKKPVVFEKIRTGVVVCGVCGLCSAVCRNLCVTFIFGFIQVEEKCLHEDVWFASSAVTSGSRFMGKYFLQKPNIVAYSFSSSYKP